MMCFAIRVDASTKIGIGHFMRCLTLADAMKQRGSRIRFASRHMPEHLRDMLAAKGHEFMLLSSSSRAAISDGLSHADWLGTSQHADAQDTIQVLADQTWDWLVIDHYALDARWECMLRQTAKNILVIDDIADRQHDCDILLDQNFYADMHTRYIGKVPPHCQLLLGPRYALLRGEFRQLRKQVKSRSGPVRRVLICFGGMDANNYIGRAIEALTNIDIPDLHVDVVIGSQHPCRKQIEFECVQHAFTCHVQTDRMAELMAAADLAIGAAGAASWERCCMGLPALIVSLADNQIEIAKGLELFGACQYIGSLEAASARVMRGAIIDLLNGAGHLMTLSEKSYSLVDGLGIDRLCEALNC